ncbi:MAG TPA: universal stress protein [Ornithinicoccus sp.]|nr:universal stress protein [Ornithinicoccus sp.]
MNIPDGAVVVGYDGSEHGQAALDWAAAYAASVGRVLVVLNAADQISYAYDHAIGLWTPESAHAAAAQVAELGVERARAEYPDLDVRAAASLTSGALALEEASATASLVVVGTRGRGRVLGTLLGSTAFAVSTHAKCPVVVVTRAGSPMPGPEHGIVVGVDGSEFAMHAVDAAIGLASEADAPLSVVAAWEVPPPDPYGHPPTGFDRYADAVAAREKQATVAAERAVAHVKEKAPGLTVRSSVVEGRAETVLAGAASQAALLVVGARGRGDLKALLLGSTSRAVLQHAPCPVYVVH